MDKSRPGYFHSKIPKITYSQASKTQRLKFDPDSSKV